LIRKGGNLFSSNIETSGKDGVRRFAVQFSNIIPALVVFWDTIPFLDTEIGNKSVGKTGSLSTGSMYLFTFTFHSEKCQKSPSFGLFSIRNSKFIGFLMPLF